MMDEQDDWIDPWVPGARSDPDYLISKWLKEQTQQRLELEAKLEAEAAQRELQEYRWSREDAAGGLISCLMKYLFMPLPARKIVFHIEYAIWQKMLMLAPDLLWGIVFTVAVAVIVATGPVVSWRNETQWRTVQAISSTVALYWVTANVLLRAISDWRFRRRLRWWASQGFVDAEFSLGSIYEAGDGIPANPKIAAHWFHKAARHGHCEAQYTLGECYFRGYGVPVNLREARKWFQRAANQGDEEAELMEDYIKKLMESPGYSADEAGVCHDCSMHFGRRYSPSAARSSKIAGETEEQRRQRKEEQRKEYERLQSERRQQAIEKRKAKAEKSRKEKQRREEQEAEIAQQKARIAALVEEETRHKVKSSSGKPQAKKPGSGAKPNGAHQPKASSSIELSKPKAGVAISSAAAAAELVEMQEKLAAKASVPSPPSSTASGCSDGSKMQSQSRDEDKRAKQQGKAGKENRRSSQIAAIITRGRSSFATEPGDSGHSPDRTDQLNMTSTNTRQLQKDSSPDAWSPDREPWYGAKSKEQQVAALTVPPPPPPPRRGVPNSTQQGQTWAQATVPDVTTPSSTWSTETESSFNAHNQLELSGEALFDKGWMPLNSSELLWQGCMDSLFGDNRGSEASLHIEAENSVVHSAYTDSTLSAVAAHYMQKAETGSHLSSKGLASPPFKSQAEDPTMSSIWSLFPMPFSSSGTKADSILDDENVCLICLDRRPSGAALVPCGHTQLCLPCARALVYNKHMCPICRNPIDEILELKG